MKFKFNFKCTKRKAILLMIPILLAVAITLLVIFLLPKSPNEPSEYFVPRVEWTEDQQAGNKLLSKPIKGTIVGQTDDRESCFTKEDCIAKIKSIRARSSHLNDIPWNFLVGGDGRVYEGRGYRYEGEHTSSGDSSDYNDVGIGIGFIGNFSVNAVPTQMMEGLKYFIRKSIEDSNIRFDSLIFFQDQLIYKQEPANELENALKSLGNFYECELLKFIKFN